MNHKEHMQRIAFNFKRLRNLRGWTQAKAAEQGEVDTSYIGQAETAQGTFSMEAQRKWAGIFGVDISEFYLPPDSTEKGGFGWVSGSGLTEAEVYLVDLFRHLNPANQEKLLFALEEISDHDTEKRKEILGKIKEALTRAS